MGQLALVGIVLCCNLPRDGMPGRLNIATMISRLFWVGVGGTLGICAVFGWSFHMQGIPLGKMVSQFFNLAEGSDAFFGLHLSRALHLPLGYLSGWYKILPPDATGIRTTLARPDAAFWVCWIATGAFLVGGISLHVMRGWWLISQKFGTIWLVTTIIAGLGLAFPLLCWDPYYDKLLLLPLMGSVAIGLAALGCSRRGTEQRQTRYRSVVGLLILEMLSTGGSTIWEWRNPKTFLDDAKVVASIVGPNDWVVLEFNPVAAYFDTMLMTDRDRSMTMPMLKKEEARSWITNAKVQCERSGGRLLFLGVLEMDRKNWDAFVGRIGGMEYDELEAERRSAKELARFKNGEQQIFLYEVPVRPVTQER